MPQRDIEVESGYPLDSKSVVFWKPKWRDSWHIPEQPDGVNKGAHVFLGSDFCLYNADILTQHIIFSTFELHTISSWPFTSKRMNIKTNLTLTYCAQLEIACAKFCYEGVGDENPWSTLGYGGDTPDYSDPISGLEDQNRPHSYRQPCVKNSETKTSLNPEAGADIADLPVAAEMIDGVEPSTNENTPLAWTGASEGVSNGYNVEDSTTVPDAGNINQEVFGTQGKRNVPRHQQQQARRVLG